MTSTTTTIDFERHELRAYATPLDAFPFTGSPAEQARFLLHLATLAPSFRNAQPWRFHLFDDGTVDFHLDLASAEDHKQADANGRLRLIGVGAAVKLFVLGGEYFGLDAEVDLFPNVDLLSPLSVAPDTIVARVRLDPDGFTTDLGARLFPFAQTRRPAFGELARGEVPDGVRRELRSVLDGYREIEFSYVTDVHAREELADAVDEANRTLYSSRKMRAEVARWPRFRRGRGANGLDPVDLGIDDWRRFWPAALVTDRSFATRRAVTESQHILDAPAILVIGTTDDAAAVWPAVGGAWVVAELLLNAHHLRVARVDEPILVPAIRSQLADRTFDGNATPQLVLRVGYAPPHSPTPRRPLDRCWVEHANV